MKMFSQSFQYSVITNHLPDINISLKTEFDYIGIEPPKFLFFKEVADYLPIFSFVSLFQVWKV